MTPDTAQLAALPSVGTVKATLPLEWCQMDKKQLQAIAKTARKSSTALTRLVPIRDPNAVHLGPHAHRKYPTRIRHIADALVAEGCVALDKQAKALGVHRSTAWTIMRTKHKLDRLSLKTTNRMLASPELPPSVRLVVLRYVTERSDDLRSSASAD